MASKEEGDMKKSKGKKKATKIETSPPERVEIATYTVCCHDGITINGKRYGPGVVVPPAGGQLQVLDKPYKEGL
jgi:hypothetical protein